ncbi:MAG: TIGR02757 family protein [Candidatus Krumholzibacteria bacterium]|nr:TIGR02757 family protein [Candidatus Krumholzibacteria bacterium]
MGVRKTGDERAGARAAVLGRAVALDRGALERLYLKYNDRRFIRSDPVEFVRRYDNSRDRELVALIASSLAFGNVKPIRASVARALEILGPAPADRVTASSPPDLELSFRHFRHRWITGKDMASLLAGVRGALKEYGSLGELFRAKLDRSDPDVAPAAGRFARTLFEMGGGYRPCLLPSPESGSACKRLNLFLRWMVRSDAVDPGGWSEVPPSMLIVPLDTHMHRISTKLGLTKRHTADFRAAREVTAAFREISPDDPVKYDFALTRLGILRGETEEDRAEFYC